MSISSKIYRSVCKLFIYQNDYSNEHDVVCDGKGDYENDRVEISARLDTWHERRSQIAEKELASRRCLPIEELKRYRQIDAWEAVITQKLTLFATRRNPRICASPPRPLNRLRVPRDEITHHRRCVRQYQHDLAIPLFGNVAAITTNGLYFQHIAIATVNIG